ncbi:potassium transport protein Kup [Haematobacter missouriensis]|uniref:Probable potassium transport system protein Kup n=1 Tax=Haematobacter missouriensis TaxID=366616 RepID=A0A212AXH5_9RHOB|nr:potassium transporter Kup [Haematobacter missouriensis]KFI34190.1 potassium transport protein Kup [Haematobacter missouriensis]OWJ72323.1 potassium transporter Kup [Haematobacter missouriensis]OWJ86172.1 potassium transporter Kup [Haematobacter missouriensis]
MTDTPSSRPNSPEPVDDASSHGTRGREGFLKLALGSVGVVYGDIGTSPLYAMREALHHAASDGLTNEEVLGVVSLLVWALFLIVTGKYVVFLLRVDNRGEGGVLALFSLAMAAVGRRSVPVFMLGIMGAALFFGDAMITPAVSVLSAVEGLELITPSFTPFVLPITIIILIGVFMVQRHGTARIGAWFGPITLIWFITMGAAGIWQISGNPHVLTALNPHHAVFFLTDHGFTAFLVLGAVFLAVTGAEALYADLGHFGRGPIRFAWLWVVLPALVLNYLGQGALVISRPETLGNPFFLMVPDWGLIPLVLLATVATVIACQAVISGAFSMTRQAVQLGLLPRFEIRHTSEQQSGQIYVPTMNWLLLIAVIWLTLAFGSSSSLASAYGIAVTGTMIVTTALAVVLAVKGWRKPLWLVLLIAAPVAVIELSFLTSNLLKILDGGYVPVLVALALMLVMWSWWRGSQLSFERQHRMAVPLESFAHSMSHSSVHIADGVAVFLTSDPTTAPPALLHNLKHNKVLHRRNLVTTVLVAEEPRVAEHDRLSYENLDDRFARITLRFGFMETPDVSRALFRSRIDGVKLEVMRTSFFLGRRRYVPGARIGMPLLLDRIYILLNGFSADPTVFYHLPRDRVVEIGARISV